MKKVLVTGGEGFIGTHLVAGLRARGIDVQSYDLKSGCDIFDRAKLRAAMAGVDTVFHLAAKVSVSESISVPLEYHAVNVSGTIVVLEEARTHGGVRVVYAGSAAVFGDEPTLPKSDTSPTAPKSPYALTKLLGEVYCKMYADLFDVDAVVVRYMNVFGPGQNPTGPYAAAVPIFIDQVQRGAPVTITGDGMQTRDYVYIDDVVRATIAAGECAAESVRGNTFVIASGVEVNLNQVVDEIEHAHGHAVQRTYIPARVGDIMRSVGDPTRAQEVLGWKCEVSLQDGISRILRA